MSKNNLLKEVIENGSQTKKVLEKEVQRGLLEMLSPKINSLVQKRLSETEDEYESEEGDEANIADLMQNIEEDSDETDLGAEDSMDSMEGEEGVSDDVTSMSKDELKDFITNAVKEALGGEAEEVDSTEIEGDDEIPVDDEGGMEGEEEEEIDEIDALIAEMSSMDAKEETETEKELNEEIKSLKKEISTLRKENLDKQKKLNESTLLIAQVVYANKLIAEHKLNQNQIVKFATILEGTKSESELKRVYNAICESIQTINVKPETKTPKVVKESWKINQSIGNKKQSLNESVDSSFARMKYNAGL